MILADAIDHEIAKQTSDIYNEQQNPIVVSGAADWAKP